VGNAFARGEGFHFLGTHHSPSQEALYSWSQILCNDIIMASPLFCVDIVRVVISMAYYNAAVGRSFWCWAWKFELGHGTEPAGKKLGIRATFDGSYDYLSVLDTRGSLLR